MLGQMFQVLNEKRSNCTLVVTTIDNDTNGYFYIKDGTLIAASQGGQDGPDAVVAMLSWDNPTITFYSLPTRIASNISPDRAASFLHTIPLLLNKSSLLDTLATLATPPVEQTEPSQTMLIKQKEMSMAVLDDALKRIMEIDGATGVAIVDWTSGMALGSVSNGLNVELAAAGNSNVIRAKTNVIKDLGIEDNIEDILITLNNQYHLIRVLDSNPNLFIYLVLNRGHANLAMARYRLTQVEKGLVI